METRLTFNPNENYEQAGLLVYGDDANYVKANMVFSGNRALEFLRETNNTAAGFDGTVNIASRPTTVDLRIVSDGTTLRAYYRFDGDPGWTLFGEPAPLAGVGANPKIGLYANDSNATVTTREDAVFDYFRVTAGVPDTTAPTSAATLDPPGGTSTGPVTVTLTGADNDGGSGLDKLEYRLDGGAWTTYSTPVTCSATGQHTLEHRATDKAGNVGTVGSVSFTIQPAGGGGDTEDSEVRGTVPGVLAVTLGAPASFGAFTPGVTRDYLASTTATVTSSAGNAALTVHDAERDEHGQAGQR